MKPCRLVWLSGRVNVYFVDCPGPEIHVPVMEFPPPSYTPSTELFTAIQTKVVRFAFEGEGLNYLHYRERA